MSEALRSLMKDEIEEARMKAVTEIATKMIEAGYDPGMVASITELPIEKVEELAGGQ